MIVTAGATNKSVYFYVVQDAGGTNPGEPHTGMLYTDLTSASYARQGAARTAITPATLASASAAHSDGGFILVDDTNMPGVYRLDVPDAAFSTGVDQVFVSIVPAGAQNAVAAPLSIDIADVDLRDAVRGGMTALPNANAEAAGGLFTRGTGAGQIDQPANGLIDVQVAAFDANVIDAASIADGAIDAATFAAGAIDAAAVATGAIDADALAADAGTEIAAAVWDRDATLSQTQGTFGQVLGDSGADADSVWSLTNTNLDAAISTRSSHSAADVWTNGTRTLTANTNLNDPTAATIADAVWDELQSAHVTVGSFGEMATEIADILTDTADMQPKLGTPVADLAADIATVDANVDLILADTGTDGVVVASINANAINAAAIATNAIDADSLAADAGTEIGTAVWASATRTLTANTNLNDPTAATIADAVWDELQSAHVTAGSFGEIATEIAAILADTGTDGVVVNSINTDAITAAALAADAGTEIGTAVWATATRVLTANTNLNDPTAATIADAVWDEAQADHVGATTFGVLATEIADILTDTADMQPKLGSPAGASISADIATVDANVDAILVDTADMQPKLGTPAGASISADIATIDTNVDAILVDTGTSGVQIDMAQALPGSPTADTTGDALKQATSETAIKKNQAFSNFEFLMVDSADGQTAKTGLSVTGERSIDGAAFAAVSGTIAEVSNGIYQFDALAADTNGDVITWRFTATGALDAFYTFKTVV